ncbi:DUF1818 family protein [[Phormidium] sp. ETS-05]|uniref:DUF1818 family protein n=1 Tax=[Phormidium] sp. ETS-05 TaxID=222819 RepID=UPI0018EF1AB0|nr:DUF1818 family protein [[Phormidium] sp. ETS-05]
MKILKSGPGWRLGWNPEAKIYTGLVGTDDWSVELTDTELDDFCRLLLSLASTLGDMAGELMDEEKIACEAESPSLWMEVEGYPDAFSLRFILQGDANATADAVRRCEGSWSPAAVPGLVAAAKTLKVF